VRVEAVRAADEKEAKGRAVLAPKAKVQMTRVSKREALRCVMAAALYAVFASTAKVQTARGVLAWQSGVHPTALAASEPNAPRSPIAGQVATFVQSGRVRIRRRVPRP
jgi:hypothetical protein